MTENLPRLLVATEFPPNASGGGPAVVRQMLKGWPVDRLFWWCCLPERNKHFSQEVAACRVAVIPPRLYPNRRLRPQRSWLMEHVWTRWAARHFRKTLRQFSPEVVWVIPHCWAIPPLAAALPYAGVGFHVSMHDYADLRGCVSRFGADRSRRMAALADKLYSSAATRDAISPPMVADLRARTGCDGMVSHAGLEQNDFERLGMKRQKPPDEIRIAYAGTIIVEETFGVFVNALARIRNQLRAPVWLDFLGRYSNRQRGWFDPSWMREHGNLAEPELSRVLRECTWGFAPMSLSDDDPRYNRFSFPTKFISYLAAGLPVITLGHPESSAVKMAQKYPVGVCMTSGEPAALHRDLLAALSIQDPPAEFGLEILRCARAEFDADRLRSTLYQCFFTCARATAAPV
jgi:hypothetical protein